MSFYDELTQNTSELSIEDPAQNHHYDLVNISGGTNVLGNVYHFNSSLAQEGSSSKNAAQDILDRLKYPEMNSRIQTLDEPYPDTFEWILKPLSNDESAPDPILAGESAMSWSSFPDWLEDGSTPYWVSGKLGTGKSTLMKYILENLNEHMTDSGRMDRIVISHFFWAPGSELQNSVVGCLRSLLWQLISFESSRNREIPISVTNLQSGGRLRKDLVTFIRELDRTLIVFLDGLDECRETDAILDLVEALAALESVKLCISSRPEEVYNLNFSDFAKLRLQDLNRKDIEHYVKTELLENPRVRRSPSWNVHAAQNLTRDIMQNAEGVFLWVRLVIKDLLRGWTNRDDLKRMQERLQKLPREIYQLYTELMRRDQEDVEGYAKDAAFYYRLLDEASNRKIPFIMFCFAVDEQIRARFLDFDTMVSISTAELEGEFSCDNVITWINVRTAGLLEIKEDIDMFIDYNDRDVQPHGELLRFRKHWIGFIHRSAYNYLKDTSEGQKLLLECATTSGVIKDIYVQSHIAAYFAFPGRHKFRQGIRIDLYRSLPILPRANPLTGEWCRLLQRTCDYLLSEGLIMTTNSWPHGVLPPQYPASTHQSVDLCQLFAVLGRLEVVEALVHAYGCQDDQEYMTEIIALAILGHNSFVLSDVVRKNEMEESFKLLLKLSTHKPTLSTVKLTSSKEETAIAIRLAEYASSTSPARKDFDAQLWKFIEDRSTNSDLQLLPISKALIEYRIMGRHGWRIDLFVSLSIKTMKAWFQDRNEDRSLAHGRALFFIDRSDKDFWEYRIIDPADSDVILENLRQHVFEASNFDESGKFASFDDSCQFFWSQQLCSFRGWDSIRQSGFRQVFERSISCASLIECLRHIGKSNETIDHVVGEQIRIASHLPTNDRNGKFFRRLLGPDPEILAPWCEKYPQLTKILEQTDESSESSDSEM